MSAKESTRLDASQPSQNIKIKLSSFSSTVVDKAAADLVVALKRVNATVLGAIPLPNATTFFIWIVLVINAEKLFTKQLY
jgi:ribosomal protein S10